MACPIGLTVESAFERILRGEPGTGRVPAYELAGLRAPKNQKFLSPAARHLMWAGLQALERSGWQRGSLDPDRTAVFTGSGQSGLEPSQTFSGFQVAQTAAGEADWAALGGRASRLLDPYFPLRSLSNSGLALLAMEIGARGPTNNFVQSDTAGVQALDAAMGCLEDGDCDLAICGAFDSLVTPANELNYRRMGLVSARGRIAPFDRQADGLVLGEAGVAMVLERRADAEARGAAVLARLSVAGDVPRPDFVVAEGHGVPQLDREAAAAIRFDGPCTAFKGATGYLGAATALVEAAFAVVALGARVVPCVAGLEELADGIELRLFRREAERLAVGRPSSALCWSRSWLGHTASITALVD